ncbi:MAG: protease modulator HflC [Desulfobacula sp.]|uniref:protease modulator HflC n=1 Tax=Desulfobacula sp. TaxID=2593537 RepID=UPI0025C15177|nr:protease modulator HflC [Desulfobacula sp.]MCD4721002.1 protease modulator HflC [Desulfobacula sp.]
MKRILKLFIIPVILVIGSIYLIFYTVDEAEYVIITEFGKYVDVREQPGLYWKLPDPFQTVTRFSKRITVYDPESVELLTLDKKNILVDNFMLWQVENPQLFLERVKDPQGAEARLSDILSSQVGAVLGKYPQSALISDKPGEMKMETMMEEAKTECARLASENYGIKVVDVRIKRLNFPKQNKSSVFGRMRAERQRIAKKFRSEGEEEAIKIEADTNREQKKILSEAYKEAQKIQGKADAEVIEIYAKAFGKDVQFYNFLRTLESYKKILNKQTTIVLPSDSNLLRLLNEGPNTKGKRD